jgi:hypothetical protein
MHVACEDNFIALVNGFCVVCLFQELLSLLRISHALILYTAGTYTA